MFALYFYVSIVYIYICSKYLCSHSSVFVLFTKHAPISAHKSYAEERAQAFTAFQVSECLRSFYNLNVFVSKLKFLLQWSQDTYMGTFLKYSKL